MTDTEDESLPIPPYDPANVIFGPTEVTFCGSVEDTAGGPVAFLGFRTSNTTFTVPLDSSAEIEEFITHLTRMKKEMKNREVKAQFALPAMQAPQSGLFVPSHIAQGPSMPLKRPQ